ncbi:DUF4111 domain-containing protein, partial [Escherichia coli]|nr:DUF4111 domain-containing protein [Escherichia coli]MDM1221207.1 DUF4111 domain-containing protein [Escherichia coli]
EWVHVQLHQQKGMISLSPPTICNSADWAMERLPAQYQPVILEARQAYLGQEEDRLASRADQLEEFVHYVKGEITKVVGK